VADADVASVTRVDGDEVPDSGRTYAYVYQFAPQLSFEQWREDPLPSAEPPPRIPGELGIPQIVLEAYQRASDRTGSTDPSCHLRWEMLAGIGQVESHHARNGLVYPDGTTFEPILGPVLDGGAYAAIRDTDGGELDGDTEWDRAVGMMQFIPGTWRLVGADGNGDGKLDPHNVYDSALAAAHYLCSGAANLADRAALTGALLRYNHSDSYVALVLAWIDAYVAGKVMPLPPRPEPTQTTAAPTKPPTSEPPTTKPPTSAPPSSPTTTRPTSPILVPPTTTAASPPTGTTSAPATSDEFTVSPGPQVR
jgi:membrane-bound lytic murein transglycosylase B